MQEMGLVSASQRGPVPGNPQDIRTLVLKLRWMGLEEEAEELSHQLAAIAPEAVLVDVLTTD